MGWLYFVVLPLLLIFSPLYLLACIDYWRQYEHPSLLKKFLQRCYALLLLTFLVGWFFVLAFLFSPFYIVSNRWAAVWDTFNEIPRIPRTLCELYREAWDHPEHAFN